jgi:hypothetical protein
MKHYDMISDSKGFAYALLKQTKTIATWYDGTTIIHFSPDSDKLGEKIYELQEKGHKFTEISQAEFQQAKNEMLGYEECKTLVQETDKDFIRLTRVLIRNMGEHSNSSMS